jgi:Predicted metal-dependent phosphoesterases (PHP family)
VPGLIADLHVHTTASDGSDAPESVVSKAAALGLAAVAIADHDTLEGIGEAMQAGIRYGVEVLPAVELGTQLGDKEIHMLGYLVDTDNRELLDHLSLFRRYRLQRAVRMVERLRRMGIDLKYERVLEIAGSGSVGRPHIARALLEAGVVASMGQAFEKYIGAGKPAFEPRHKCSPSQAVRIIRKSGGVAVFAHPGLAGCDQIIPSLAEEGLQGLEVYHPGPRQRGYLSLQAYLPAAGIAGNRRIGLPRKQPPGSTMCWARQPLTMLLSGS